MENPFKYGGIVRGPYFADRKQEIEELLREMDNRNRIFLISPRRFGKTCLLFNLMDRLQESGMATVYLDINAYPDIRSFAAAISHMTARALESNVDRLLKILSGFQRLRPKISVGHDGSISTGVEVVVEEKNAVSALIEGMSQAEDLSGSKKKKLVIIIDEFSDIRKYNGQTIEKALRSEIQKHENIAYIFSGSEQSVMLSMVQDKSRAFYKLGRIMQLNPIKQDAYGRFIRDWLKKNDCRIENDVLNRIFEIGDSIPYNIQRLCHNLWEKAREGFDIDIGLIDELPLLIASQDSPHYELMWQSISSLQRSLLIALNNTPDLKPFSKEFQMTHGIGPSSSINASLESLCKKGIMQKKPDGLYRFSDIFMQFWLNNLILQV